jgi:hypothetical protein
VSRRAINPTLAALVALLACNQAVLAGSRVAVSLDALHRGASAATVGVLMATFGLVPMILALHAGPWVDRVGTLRPDGGRHPSPWQRAWCCRSPGPACRPCSLRRR